MASNLRYYIINKPCKVLSQYTDTAKNRGLGSILRIPKGIYSVGRLDFDSEGLLILTNDKRLNQALLHPENKHIPMTPANSRCIPHGQGRLKSIHWPLVRINTANPN